MIVDLAAKLFLVVAAAATPPVIVAMTQDPPAHEKGCSGCEAKKKAWISKYSSINGQLVWEDNAGSIDLGAPTEKKNKNGRCKRKRGDAGQLLNECEQDPDHVCESSWEAVINSVTPNSYISGTAFGGCVAFASASAENKTLSAPVTGCGAESTDEVQAHNSSACTLAIGSQKASLKVWCEHCKYTAP